MKNKRLLHTSMIAALIVSMIATGAAAVYKPHPDNKPYFHIDPDPKELVTTADLTCTSFTIDVRLYNVSAARKILGYEFQLWYNSTLIKATTCTPWNTTNVPPGVNPVGTSFGPLDPINMSWIPINNKIKPGVGRVWVMAALPIAKPWSGSATAIKITFHIEQAPPKPDPWELYTYLNCTLKLNGTVLGDTSGLPIPHGVDDGFYNYKRGPWPQPGAPVADFVFDRPMAYVCEEVTCTDQSTPDGGNIIARLWAIEGNATNTTAMDGTVMKFHCDAAGIVNVTLTVWDDEGFNSTKTKSIEQKEKLGYIIDVYTGTNRFCGQQTPFIGKGEHVYADAYSPDVMVELFAEVTWNGKPVMHVLVAFEVLFELNETHQYPPPRIYEPLNACVTYRTAETDKDGIARIQFRIPNPCDGPMFGKWLVIVSAKVQEVKKIDYLRFDVGYVITLLDMWTLKQVEPGVWEPTDEFLAPCDWVGIAILLKNIMWIEKEVTLVVVVYDDCDVPVGQIIVTIPIPAGEWCNPYNETIVIIPGIHLPQWTYVGKGKVYVSAFTALPQLCGSPYCPEISHEIVLEWSGL